MYVIINFLIVKLYFENENGEKMMKNNKKKRESTRFLRTAAR